MKIGVSRRRRYKYKRRYKWSRIWTITAVAVVHVVLVLIAILAILDIWTLCDVRISGILGLIAFGSAAAFFTACQNTMNRVPYGKHWWKRGLECVYRASQLEALFRMLVGVSVGSGSYLLILLAERLKDV